LHILLLAIIEKGQYLLSSAPAIAGTRKFRSFAAAYLWVLNNQKEAMDIKVLYKVPGKMDLEFLTMITPMFVHFSTTIDICETNQILRSEKLNLAFRFKQCTTKLPKNGEGISEFVNFRKVFEPLVMEKIFGEVITVVDYWLCMMIPHEHFKTLKMLTRLAAEEQQELVLQEVSRLLEQKCAESEPATSDTLNSFFSKLHKKTKQNEQEKFLHNYAFDADLPDLHLESFVDRSKKTLDYWATYTSRKGDRRYAEIVLDQLVGFCGTDISERCFSTVGAQTGNKTSPETSSMKVCIKTGRNSGLYQLLMDKIKFKD